jgi:hypothetical protein
VNDVYSGYGTPFATQSTTQSATQSTTQLNVRMEMGNWPQTDVGKLWLTKQAILHIL